MIKQKLQSQQELDRLQPYGNIVMDFDDILCHMSIAWYMNIHANFEGRYDSILKDKGVLGVSGIYSRDVYDLGEWLLKDFEQKQKEEALKAAGLLFINDFFSKDYYDLLVPTDFAMSILGNSVVYNFHSIKAFYIIDRSIPGTKQSTYRQNWLSYWFRSNKKIKTLSSPIGTSLPYLLKGYDWNLAVLNEIPDLLDVLSDKQYSGKEILMPEYGYNKIPLEATILAEDRQINLSVFSNYKTIVPYDLNDATVPNINILQEITERDGE